MNQIFLGEPVQEIKNWFVNTYLTGPDYSNWPTYTTLKFVDGTTETKEISGIATRQNIFDEQLYDCAGDEKTETLVYCQLGNNVTEINNHTFFICYSLTSIDIPNSVTSIGWYSIAECSSLTSVTIPNSVTTIEGYAFEYCFSLPSINIPSSVISIGHRAFNCCSSLSSVIFEGRTSAQITAMANYPWSIPNTSAIKPGIS